MRAKEVVALLNLRGGHVLLGVEDDGSVSGLTRARREVEEWVMNICRNNIQPPLIPFWETIALDDGKLVGVLSLPDDAPDNAPDNAPDKPYKARRGAYWITYVRVGSTCRV